VSGLGIVTQRDDISSLLERVKDAAAAKGLTLVMGRAVANQVRDHLVALNAERHRYGRNYYAQAARSVGVRATEGFALVTISQVGIRQRYYGGTIVPRTKRYLTIPARPEAYGMRAGEFNDLDFTMVLDPKSGNLRAALVRRASSSISIVKRKRKDGSFSFKTKATDFNAGGVVMFWLVRKVSQAADPSVLPTREEMLETAFTAGKRRLDRLAERAQGGPTA
jgi:hypothetical protein